MEKIVYLNSDFIQQETSYKALINKLRDSFKTNKALVPLRHHHNFPTGDNKDTSTLLLMPAWNPDKDAGVKMVTVCPKNTQLNLPTIQGLYIYLNSETGEAKAILDAKELTVKRTAATSALVSSYLSKENSNSLLMLGTGALSANLIKAHASVRPIEKVYVWGRDLSKAQNIALNLKNEEFIVEPVESYSKKISEVDIISCATLSTEPLVNGEFIREGQHIDLVGSYKPDMREADDQALLKSSIYVDTVEGACSESGDLFIPIQSGIIQKSAIKSDLFGLCAKDIFSRTDDREITLFKSVGHALEDLVAAGYYFNIFNNQSKNE